MYIYLIDDFSRVTLDVLDGEKGSDYINASYIDVRIISMYIIISIYLHNNISTCKYYVMDISLSGGRLWAYTAREIIVEGVARDYYLKGGIRP